MRIKQIKKDILSGVLAMVIKKTLKDGKIIRKTIDDFNSMEKYERFENIEECDCDAKNVEYIKKQLGEEYALDGITDHEIQVEQILATYILGTYGINEPPSPSNIIKKTNKLLFKLIC